MTAEKNKRNINLAVVLAPSLANRKSKLIETGKERNAFDMIELR